jgi:murein L,D-transpeptidase YcbB/YkuD
MSTCACFLLLFSLVHAGAKEGLSQFPLRFSIYQNSQNNTLLNKLYATRDYNPIFVTSENQVRMSALLNALEGSNYHGIPSELYGLKKLYSDIDDLRSELKLGALEIELAKKFILYVKHMKLGVLDPKEINMRLIERESLETEKKISTQLDLKLRKINFIEIFTEFMITNPFKYLEQLQPQADDYKTLLKEKILLEKTLSLGGWGETVAADILRSGESGGEVTKLRNRLIRMGYLKKTYSPVYDSGLKSAVKKFQGAHGLKSDGIAGKITIAEINIPSSERLKLIVASLERRRWLNKPYDGKYVVVNIPEFKLRIVNKGETTYESKVVVGKNSPSTYTPEFSNKLKFLVINPSWYVPKSIVIEEYLPDIRENINASSELFFTDKNGQFISREIINFDEFDDEEFPYGMKQPPSPNNPLGQVKFMLPNRHNIYLHDSPSKELFLEEERAFSHGCVRVHEPFKLAYEILKDNIEDPSFVLNYLLKNTKEFKLTLKDDIPVHIVYLTAWSDSGDHISYRKDIYGRDSEIYQSLENIKQKLMIKKLIEKTYF